MEPYNASDGPAIDRGVLERMKRLDRNLHVTFSHYAIDYSTGCPVEVIPGPDWEHEPVRRGDAWFVADPAFHLWVRGEDSLYHIVKSYPAELGFGQREVLGLEADVMRFMTPTAFLYEKMRNQARQEEKEHKDYKELRQDIAAENKSIIRDTVGLGDRDYTPNRQAKIVSYAGQGSRATPGDVRKSDKEAGWVKPE